MPKTSILPFKNHWDKEEPILKLQFLTIAVVFLADLLHKWSSQGMTDIHKYWSKMTCIFMDVSHTLEMTICVSSK